MEGGGRTRKGKKRGLNQSFYKEPIVEIKNPFTR
jgi:hypothetical protein